MKRKVYINEEKKTIVVKLIHDTFINNHFPVTFEATGKAKCLEEDEFDIKTGIRLATKKAKRNLNIKKIKAYKCLVNMHKEIIDGLEKDVNILIENNNKLSNQIEESLK